MTDDAVVVEGLEKHFGDVVALRGVSFRAAKGSCLAVLGPNGAGKTTTINILSTLLKPSGGRASVNGFDVVDEASDVRESIMLTGQYAALDESLTGRENVVLFGRLMGLGRRAARIRADELLEEFDLTDAATRKVSGYSGGMRRRIDIACGLVVRPEVVFLDEPTTGLDPRSRQAVWDLVGRLKAQGITIILTTQYLEEADVLADNIVVIDRGVVVAEGTASALKERTGNAFCEIVPQDASQLPQLARALGDLMPATSAPSADDIHISFPAPEGSTTLAKALRRIEAAGLVVTDIGLRRPSLDEVFLSVTDRDGQKDTGDGQKTRGEVAANDAVSDSDDSRDALGTPPPPRQTAAASAGRTTHNGHVSASGEWAVRDGTPNLHSTGRHHRIDAAMSFDTTTPASGDVDLNGSNVSLNGRGESLNRNSRRSETLDGRQPDSRGHNGFAEVRTGPMGATRQPVGRHRV